jgi:hypothetical protein
MASTQGNFTVGYSIIERPKPPRTSELSVVAGDPRAATASFDAHGLSLLDRTGSFNGLRQGEVGPLAVVGPRRVRVLEPGFQPERYIEMAFLAASLDCKCHRVLPVVHSFLQFVGAKDMPFHAARRLAERIIMRTALLQVVLIVSAPLFVNRIFPRQGQREIPVPDNRSAFLLHHIMTLGEMSAN